MKINIPFEVSIKTRIYTHKDGRIGVQTVFKCNSVEQASCQCIDEVDCTKEEFLLFMNGQQKVHRMGVQDKK